jgi:hypothetical protein
MRFPFLTVFLLVTQPALGAVITGTVIGEGARPVAGATVEVVQAPDAMPCRTSTAADGTFTLRCAATGPHPVRASLGDLRPWQVDDIDLTPDAEVHLNFLLVPATTTALDGSLAVTAHESHVSLWARPVPNPVLAHWQGRPITLRMLAIAVAPVSFVLGGLTMFALGRRFGIATRRLSAGEVADTVLNPNMPTVGERTSPIAVAGARGAEARVSYGGDEISAALAARRYGLVFTALVIAPGLFAVFSLALALAMLIGHETYLLGALLLVPAGFVLTSIIIGVLGLRTNG